MFQARITKNNFAAIEKALRPKVNAEVLSAMSDAAAIARQLCPVDTGALRDSIAVSQNSEGTTRLVVGMPYAGFVENGHHDRNGGYVPAQPFVAPALESVKPNLEKRLNKILER